MIELLVFDLDGVITSEGKYWNTARLTVWDVFCGSDFCSFEDFFASSLFDPGDVLQFGQQVISDSFIRELKIRAVNSNWDLAYFVVSLYLISVLKNNPSIASLKHLTLREQLQAIGEQLQANHNLDLTIIDKFWAETKSLQGSQVSDYLVPFAQKIINKELDEIISLNQLWSFCYELFQAWYQGERGFILPDDQTVLGADIIEESLSSLAQKYDLGIATGRPRAEVIEPLSKLDLLKYFNSQRIVTYDEVIEAESLTGNQIKLGKPHPYILFRAINPQLSLEEILKKDFQLEYCQKVAYIGDAGSDVVAAKKAGCLSVGVLTGFSTAQSLLDLGCDMIVQDISHLNELF